MLKQRHGGDSFKAMYGAATLENDNKRFNQYYKLNIKL